MKNNLFLSEPRVYSYHVLYRFTNFRLKKGSYKIKGVYTPRPNQAVPPPGQLKNAVHFPYLKPVSFSGDNIGPSLIEKIGTQAVLITWF